jgi:hypothetical protein
LTYDNGKERAQLYLGWRWRQARGSAGRTATPTETIGVAEVLWVPSDSCSAKLEKQHYKYKISAEPPLHGEVSKTCKKEVSSMPDNTYKARWPHIHNSGLKKFRVQLLALEGSKMHIGFITMSLSLVLSKECPTTM